MYILKTNARSNEGSWNSWIPCHLTLQISECIWNWLQLWHDMVQVNQILSAIKRKKSMDTIILSLVASVCTFLIFIYWLSKWGCDLYFVLALKLLNALSLMLWIRRSSFVSLRWHIFLWIVLSFISVTERIA